LKAILGDPGAFSLGQVEINLTAPASLRMVEDKLVGHLFPV